jgi:hypothetical protein
MRITFLALMFSLVGCTTVQTIPGPDGDQYYIHCRSTAANCYQEAARRCPKGYEIIDKLFGAPGVYEIFIKCNK